MAQAKLAQLDDGDAFPSLAFQMLDGSSMAFPEAVEGQWTVLLVYRGEW